MQTGMIITDGPFSGSGFGEEMRNVLFRLVQTGRFKIFWFNLQHSGFDYDIIDEQFPDIPHKGARITILGHRPMDRFKFGAEHFAIHWARHNPDWVLFMGDPKNIRPYVMGNLGESNKPDDSLKRKLGFPLAMYVTLDGLPISPSWLDYLKHVNVLIAMTEWAQMEYVKVGLSPTFIHHGVNWNWWATNPEEKARLRKKYKIPNDWVIYINWEVPQHRKRPDALLRAWRDFRPEKKKARLILYCDWSMGNTLGYNIENLIKQYNVPRQTIINPLQLQKRPKFWACPERPETLLEIAKLGDVYVTTTSGEGFGKCTLESLSLGMPVVIPNYSACPEVCRRGSILVPITGTYRMDDRRRSVEGGIVDEEEFTKAITDLYYNKQMREELSREARQWAQNFDYDTIIIPNWINLLESINWDSITLKELLHV